MKLNVCPHCSSGELVMKQDAEVTYSISEGGRLTLQDDIGFNQSRTLECRDCFETSNENKSLSDRLKEIDKKN